MWVYLAAATAISNSFSSVDFTDAKPRTTVGAVVVSLPIPSARFWRGRVRGEGEGLGFRI